MIKIKGVILIKPKNAANVGLIARSMKAFGIENLVIVKKDINEKFMKKAIHISKQGKDILEKAKFVRNLKEIKGKKIATTSEFDSKKYAIPINLMKITDLRKSDDEYYLVFGRESTGLLEAEIKECEIHANIPTNGKYGILNLAMAATIFIYELSKRKS